MKYIKYLWIVLLSVTFMGCSDDPEDEGIKLKDTPKEINFYADGQEVNNKKSITFTAAGPWAAIASSTSRDAIDWIKIDPTSGNAGTYTITITLSVNTTGQDRVAYIIINCEGSEVTITIKQKGTDAEGNKPTDPDLNRSKMRPVNRITLDYDTPFNYEGVYAVDFKYDKDNRISEMWCYIKGMGDDADYTEILTVDYSIAGELRISNPESGTWYIALDQNGRATGAKNHQSEEEYEFSYDTSGRLTEVHFVDKEDSEEDIRMKISYTDGLMTGFHQTEDGETFFKEDYTVNELYPNGIMNYTSNYDFNALMLFDLWGFDQEIVVPLYYMRYLGNTKDCLYMQINLDDDEEEEPMNLRAYHEPNTTYQESSSWYSYGLSTDAEYVIDGTSPLSIKWNKPFTMYKATWTVTTNDQLINPDAPELGYQYTVSDRKEESKEHAGLHQYKIDYR